MCCAGALSRGDDPALVSLGVDDACTGGSVVTQSALAEAFAHEVAAGRVECDPATLGATLEEQVATGRRILLASGVHSRGSQRPAESYFVRTPGLPSLAAEPLLERFHLAASRALHRWTQLGGAGAAGVTHLVVGSTTPPRSAPGTCDVTTIATTHSALTLAAPAIRAGHCVDNTAGPAKHCPAGAFPPPGRPRRPARPGTGGPDCTGRPTGALPRHAFLSTSHLIPTLPSGASPGRLRRHHVDAGRIHAHAAHRRRPAQHRGLHRRRRRCVCVCVRVLHCAQPCHAPHRPADRALPTPVCLQRRWWRASRAMTCVALWPLCWHVAPRCCRADRRTAAAPTRERARLCAAVTMRPAPAWPWRCASRPTGAIRLRLPFGATLLCLPS